MKKVTKENSEHYAWGDLCSGWHLAKSSQLSVIREHVPVGAQETRHYHRESEQFFFCLSGVATLECDGTRHYLSALEGLHVMPGVKHQLMNEQTEPLEFLVISAPPSHEDRYPA